MSVTTLTGFRQLGIDLRKLVVDILEYAYGPLLVSILFSLFLTLDPAKEALIVFASEAQALILFFFGINTSEGFMYYLVRTLSGVTIFMFVPVFLYVALEIVLETRRTTAARSALSTGPPVIPPSVTSATPPALERALLLIIGRLPLFSAAGVLLGLSFESEGKEIDWTLRILALICTIPIFHLIYRLVKPSTKSGLLSRMINWMVNNLPLVGGGLFAIVLWTAGVQVFSVLIGPVGVISLFIVFTSLALALLTKMSTFATRERFPLILLVIGLLWASGSPTSAAILGGLTALYAIVKFVRGRIASVPQDIRGLTVFGCFGLSYFLLFAIPTWFPAKCGALSGCNTIIGVEGTASSELQDALVDWQSTSKDNVLRIVAAQGGGLYAAYHTAHVLAWQADTNGQKFTNSLFAISGVSGGSVGAGIFAALVDSGLCMQPQAGPTCYRDAVDQILTQDYLSPVLTGMLFRDTIDAFVPYSALMGSPVDRGNVLEDMLATFTNLCCSEELDDAKDIGNEFLHLGVSKSWGVKKIGGVDIWRPLLLFNSTNVANGIRMTPRPVRLQAPKDQEAAWSQPVNLVGGKELSVVNAMVMSARFPLVSPPGRVNLYGDEGPTQLADGGFFDNSGIETVIDLLRSIQTADPEGIGRIEILVFNIKEAPPDEEETKGLLAAPFSSFVSAWRARLQTTLQNLCSFASRGDSGAPPVRVVTADITLTGDDPNFTLSWLLSEQTFRSIASFSDEEHKLRCG